LALLEAYTALRSAEWADRIRWTQSPFPRGHAQGVRAPMRMIAAITIRPNATDARTVTKLAVELMSFLRGIW